MLKRSLLVLGLAGVMASGAFAESSILYRTIDDSTPGDDTDVVVGVGESATIEVLILPGEPADSHFGGGGFAYVGTAENGTIDAGGYILSNHAWDDAFGDPNAWFITDPLPNPQAVGFFPPGLAINPGGTLLTTLTITGVIANVNDGEPYVQQTGVTAVDSGLVPIDLTPGSDSFNITVTPEPATVALLLIGGLSALRRRQ